MKRRVFFTPSNCTCKMEDYLLWVKIPPKYPDYNKGPMPDWVSCKPCNEERHRRYPLTKKSRILPCERKPSATLEYL